MSIESKFILVLIGLSLQSIIKAELPRYRLEHDDQSHTEQRIETLEREIARLKTDNRYLRLKLERVEQKAAKLEEEIKSLNLGTCKNESNLEKIPLEESIDNQLKASIFDCLLRQIGVKQAGENTKATTPKDRESTAKVNYDEHFNCIANCENANSDLPTTCAEALARNRTGDGVYQIYATNSSLKPFAVYCLQDAYSDNAWMVIQRRQVGSTNFARNWTDYMQGFGDLNADYWLGLARIYALTTARKHELWIQMKDNNGVARFANYAEFAIGNETENFKLLRLENYTGDAGDSLGFNYDAQFSTYDHDNDDDAESNCAEKRMGGWWFRDCKHSLNGIYNSTNYGTGINWIGWHDYRYSLNYVHIAIRPVAVDLFDRTPLVVKPVWYDA